MKRSFLIPLFSVLIFSGCIQTIAIQTVGGIVDDGFEAMTEEQDLVFAEQAIPANLKLLEVMLKSDPDNRRILKLLAEGYSSYTLGFVEDTDQERARVLYLRSRDYGLRLMKQDPALAKAVDGSLDEFKAVLAKQSKESVPGVFWTAFGWGSYVNITLTSPDALAALPKVEEMMKFVVAQDPTYYYGGAHLFLGTLYGSRSKFLGGDMDLSKMHFEKAIEITQGKFLMTHLFYAKSYAVQTLNEELFEELLSTVEETSLEVMPTFRLGNAIAKKKAQLLLAKKEELF